FTFRSIGAVRILVNFVIWTFIILARHVSVRIYVLSECFNQRWFTAQIRHTTNLLRLKVRRYKHLTGRRYEHTASLVRLVLDVKLLRITFVFVLSGAKSACNGAHRIESRMPAA